MTHLIMINTTEDQINLDKTEIRQIIMKLLNIEEYIEVEVYMKQSDDIAADSDFEE